MLSVSVHKDVGEYEPKIIGKLTLRSLVSSVLALGVAVLIGAYFWFVLGISTSISQYVIYAAAMPIWAAGFWRPKNMKAEDFLPLWLDHTFSDGRLLYSSKAARMGLCTPPHAELTKNYRKLTRTRAIEAYEPLVTYEQKRDNHDTRPV